MAVENPGLGTLSKIYPEIRVQIWKDVLQKGVPESSKSKIDSAILRASHQLHDEISFEFYHLQILRIKISPRYRYRSWITISNLEGFEWHLKDLRDAASRGFQKLPYRWLKQLKIEIEAPDPEDPGQMLCLWRKAQDLVELLEKADGLPSVEILLQDTEGVKWCCGDEAQQSISMDPADNTYDPDFEVILALFARLRNAGEVKVRLSGELAEFCGDGIENPELAMTYKELFGMQKDSYDLEILCIQEYQDEWFMAMDHRLDTMPGHTAAMMRLERFSTWYADHLHGESKYMNELQRIISNGRGRGSENDVFAIGYRYRAMRAMNPFCGKGDGVWLDTSGWLGTSAWLNLRTAEMEFGDLNEEYTQYTRRWVTKRWHTRFIHGIEPFNTVTFERDVLRRGDNGLAQEDWSYIYHRFLYQGQDDEGNMRPDLGETAWNPSFSIMEDKYDGYNAFRLSNLSIHLTERALLKKKEELTKRLHAVEDLRDWLFAVSPRDLQNH
jgi:hypothetical protein